MFARVTTIEGSAERLEEGSRFIQEQVMPALRELPGSKGALFLVDRASGKAIGITVWESEQAMAESRERANELRSQAAETAGAGQPSVEEYEVALWDVTG